VVAGNGKFLNVLKMTLWTLPQVLNSPTLSGFPES
jgi:hypothetical protein